jgi:hypothetical protein
LLAIGVAHWLRARQDATDSQRRRDWRWWETHFEAMRRTAVDMADQDLGLGQILEQVNRVFLKHLQELDKASRSARAGATVPMPPPGCHLPFELLLHREDNGKVQEG